MQAAQLFSTNSPPLLVFSDLICVCISFAQLQTLHVCSGRTRQQNLIHLRLLKRE